ncbi:hypothetical protein DICA0_B13608 [Diutina catenulata]
MSSGIDSNPPAESIDIDELENELDDLLYQLDGQGHWSFTFKIKGQTSSFTFGRDDSLDFFKQYRFTLYFDLIEDTNSLGLPMLNLFGTEATGSCFCISSTFLTQKRPEDVIQVLECLKRKLGDSEYHPDLCFFTTRCFDFALPAAKQCFPDSKLILCKADVLRTIAKYAKGKIPDSTLRSLQEFTISILELESVDEYEENVQRLLQEDQRELFKYIGSWLKHREYLDPVWTKKYEEFGFGDPMIAMTLNANIELVSQPWFTLREMGFWASTVICKRNQAILNEHERQSRI